MTATVEDQQKRAGDRRPAASPGSSARSSTWSSRPRRCRRSTTRCTWTSPTAASTRTLTLEVEQHIGDNMVRAISLQPTDGLVRGAEVTYTGAPITVPVGDVTKGHVFNVLGDPLDVPKSSLDITERWPIHRPAAAARPARVQDRDVRHRHQGHRPARPRTCAAARSACSAAPAWARRCSSRR